MERERTQQVIPVRRPIPHPRYNNKTWANDIMLLQVGHVAALSMGPFHPGFCIPHDLIPDPPPVQPLRDPNAEKKATPLLSCSLYGSSVGKNAFFLLSADEEGKCDHCCEPHQSAQGLGYSESRDTMQCGWLGAS